MKKSRFFDKNHGLTPLQNVDFFDLFRTSLFRSKKLYFLSRISKNLSFWLFWNNKRIKKKIFWQKQWTNPFAKCRFFFDFVRTSLLGSKKLYFQSRISKNVSFWLFLLKKKHFWKRSIFWQKPWTNPFGKCRFFSTLWELHFWGPKSIIIYPEYQRMFLSGFFC